MEPGETFRSEHRPGAAVSNRGTFSSIRRHGVPIVLCTILGAAIGFAASAVVPIRYTSSSTVLVSQVSADPAENLSADIGDVDVETETIVAESRTVAELANELLAGQAPGTSGDKPDAPITASAVGDSRVMRLVYEAESPGVAQRGAAAYADAYVTVRSDFLTDQRSEAEAQLEARIEELKFLLGTLPAQPDGDDAGDVRDITVEVERSTLESELLVNQRALANLRTVSSELATIVDPAQLPENPSSLGSRTLIISGAVLGLAVGVAVALLADAVRQRPEPVLAGQPAASHSPALAEPDQAQPGLASAATAAPALLAPRPTDEDVRRLNAVFTQVAGASSSLMPAIHRRVVTGKQLLLVVDDDGHSSAAVALALSNEIARRGATTVLIESSVVIPSLAKLASVPHAPGLAEHVRDPWAAKPHPYPGVSGLEVLPAGDGDVSTGELEATLANFTRSYDAVVLIAGRAAQSPILSAPLAEGAAIVATRAPANPTNLPTEDLDAIETSVHELIGIISIGDKPLPEAQEDPAWGPAT